MSYYRVESKTTRLYCHRCKEVRHHTDLVCSSCGQIKNMIELVCTYSDSDGVVSLPTGR